MFEIFGARKFWGNIGIIGDVVAEDHCAKSTVDYRPMSCIAMGGDMATIQSKVFATMKGYSSIARFDPFGLRRAHQHEEEP